MKLKNINYNVHEVTLMNIFNKLDQIIDLTDNEKVLVAYMKQHTDDFMKYNATQIAENVMYLYQLFIDSVIN